MSELLFFLDVYEVHYRYLYNLNTYNTIKQRRKTHKINRNTGSPERMKKKREIKGVFIHTCTFVHYYLHHCSFIRVQACGGGGATGSGVVMSK